MTNDQKNDSKKLEQKSTMFRELQLGLAREVFENADYGEEKKACASFLNCAFLLGVIDKETHEELFKLLEVISE